MAKLSVLVTCKNERHNLGACVESVRSIADEILVADSGSTDGTLELIGQLGGCRLIERAYVNPADFKNWAIPQAAHPWVLIVDADERVSDRLAHEIKELMADEPDADGYTMRMENYFLGHPIRHCGWNTTRVLRLFRRDVGRYRKQRVHESLEISTGKVRRLEGRFIHHTCSSLVQYMEKMNRYTTWAAQDAYERGRRVSLLGVMLRPPARFLQFYFYRAGVLDGFAGAVVCMLTGFYTFLKYAKLWELQCGRPQCAAEANQDIDHRPDNRRKAARVARASARG